MAEGEQKHRHEMERQTLELGRDGLAAEIHAHKRGQWFAFGTFVAAAVLTWGFVTKGAPGWGAGIMGAELVTAVGLFLKRKRDQEAIMKRQADDTKPHEPAPGVDPRLPPETH
jgi:uncharacterized membrane protein